METLPWLRTTEEGNDSSMMMLLLRLPPSLAWLGRGEGGDDALEKNEVDVVLLVVEAEAAVVEERDSAAEHVDGVEMSGRFDNLHEVASFAL